jgi:hypothetical protein
MSTSAPTAVETRTRAMPQVAARRACLSRRRPDGFVEVDPAPVDAFSGRVHPVAGRDREACGGLFGRVARRVGAATSGHHPAPLVGEDESAAPVGVAFDAQQAPVMGSMVGAAEAHQIGGVGGPAVLPVHQVADLQPAAAVAPRRHAAPITLLHGDAGARRDDALGSALAEGHTMALPHRLDRPVAPQQASGRAGPPCTPAARWRR